MRERDDDRRQVDRLHRELKMAQREKEMSQLKQAAAEEANLAMEQELAALRVRCKNAEGELESLSSPTDGSTFTAGPGMETHAGDVDNQGLFRACGSPGAGDGAVRWCF